MALSKKNTLGLSQSELKTYFALLKHNPANGSQLSRHSGVARPNIYDILTTLIEKGMATELNSGLYAPLPPDEFLKRLQLQFDTDITSLEEQIESVSKKPFLEYIWIIKGYKEVMAKAKDLIDTASSELYVILYPKEAEYLDSHLLEAAERGVEVKYVSMGTPLNKFEFQVIHPDTDKIETTQSGRVFNVVRDKSEVVSGLFNHDKEDDSSINWARNNWFVAAVRQGVRHDFFHYFIHKIIDRGEELNDQDMQTYNLIKKDSYARE